MRKLLLLLFVTYAASVKAQIPQPDPDTTAKHFLIVASIKNLQEISAGEQAVQKAVHPDIKAFGQMMVKDHGDAEQKLLALAKRKGIALPSGATSGIKPDLSLKYAVNFDQSYVHDMVSGHDNTVQVFQNYAVTGKDPDVKVFAKQMLPVLKKHLADIKTIEEKMMATSNE